MGKKKTKKERRRERKKKRKKERKKERKEIGTFKKRVQMKIDAVRQT